MKNGVPPQGGAPFRFWPRSCSCSVLMTILGASRSCSPCFKDEGGSDSSTSSGSTSRGSPSGGSSSGGTSGAANPTSCTEFNVGGTWSRRHPPRSRRSRPPYRQRQRSPRRPASTERPDFFSPRLHSQQPWFDGSPSSPRERGLSSVATEEADTFSSHCSNDDDERSR